MNFTKKGKTCHGTPASRRAEFGDFTGGNLLAALLWLNVRRGTAHSLALLWQVVFECSPAIVTGEMKIVGVNLAQRSLISSYSCGKSWLSIFRHWCLIVVSDRGGP